jgi:hypothetical protein
MTSPGRKLTALASHPTKKVNKAEELAYLSTNIVLLDACTLFLALYFLHKNNWCEHGEDGASWWLKQIRDHIHNTSFSSQLTNWQIKLECLSLTSLSSLVYYNTIAFGGCLYVTLVWTAEKTAPKTIFTKLHFLHNIPTGQVRIFVYSKPFQPSVM